MPIRKRGRLRTVAAVPLLCSISNGHRWPNASVHREKDDRQRGSGGGQAEPNREDHHSGQGYQFHETLPLTCDRQRPRTWRGQRQRPVAATPGSARRPPDGWHFDCSSIGCIARNPVLGRRHYPIPPTGGASCLPHVTLLVSQCDLSSIWTDSSNWRIRTVWLILLRATCAQVSTRSRHVRSGSF